LARETQALGLYDPPDTVRIRTDDLALAVDTLSGVALNRLGLDMLTRLRAALEHPS
jgi:hypothetical protein